MFGSLETMWLELGLALGPAALSQPSKAQISSTRGKKKAKIFFPLSKILYFSQKIAKKKKP